MTAKLSTLDLASLYERDIVLWSERTVELLRQGRFDELDIDNLIDEVGDLSKRERDRLISSIRLIMHHLLKWDYQSEKRSSSWTKTIKRERLNAQTYLEDTPSLRRFINSTWMAKTYKIACRQVAIETDLPLKVLPENCPYSWEQILNGDLSDTNDSY